MRITILIVLVTRRRQGCNPPRGRQVGRPPRWRRGGRPPRQGCNPPRGRRGWRPPRGRRVGRPPRCVGEGVHELPCARVYAGVLTKVDNLSRLEGVRPHPPRGHSAPCAARACGPIRREGVRANPPQRRVALSATRACHSLSATRACGPIRREDVHSRLTLETASIKMCGPGGNTGTSPGESVASNSKNGSHKVV